MSKEKTAELNKAIKLKQKGYTICWSAALPIVAIGFLLMMCYMNNTAYLESEGNPVIALILAVYLVVSYAIGFSLILYADSKIKEIEFSEDQE